MQGWVGLRYEKNVDKRREEKRGLRGREVVQGWVGLRYEKNVDKRREEKRKGRVRV